MRRKRSQGWLKTGRNPFGQLIGEESAGRKRIIQYFERQFGAQARFVPPVAGTGGARRMHPDVFALPPHAERSHWVLFTLGTSAFSLNDDEEDDEDEDAPREKARYIELIMSVAGDWHVRDTWLPHVLRYSATMMLLDGHSEGLLLFDDWVGTRSPNWIAALFVAPSRQMEPPGRVLGLSEEEAIVCAAYPVTLDQFMRQYRDPIDVAALPEVIVQWRDMLRSI